MTTASDTDFIYSVDFDTYLKWEAWHFGLKAALHESAYEELASDGPISILDEFFEVYGLALEQAYGFPSLIGFVADEPTRPKRHPDHVDIPLIRSRIDAALSGKDIDYPVEKLPLVAIMLRSRAAAFASLAERIEQGTFEFPKE